MAYSLRLSEALDREARSRCERLGISLNGLISVALDAYLRGPESPAKPEAVAFAQQLDQLVQPLDGRPTAKPHKVLHPSSSSRAAGESSFAPIDPKPVLGPGAGKVERSRLADWHRRNPKPKA